MNKEKNLSEELQNYVRLAYEKAKSDGVIIIPMSSLLQIIFKDYIENKGECRRLNDFFSSFSEVQKKCILETVKIFADSDTEKLVSLTKLNQRLIKFQNKDVIEVCPDISTVIDKLDDSKMEIDTFQFVKAALNPENIDDSEVVRGLKMCGVDGKDLLNREDIVESMSKVDEAGRRVITSPDDFFNQSIKVNNPEGELKEKRLSPEQYRKDMEDFEKAGSHEEVSPEAADPNSTTPFLDQFSFDMTKAEKNGKYDPVVGRMTEIDQIIKILCCRVKKNAVLLGEAGVGKTAIVESLVRRINEGNVPEQLKEKRVCSLDLNALVSGTKYRGEYEARLQGIIKEVCNHPEIIVYIDEFHNLVGNGSSAGNGDGANILKPYLARGEFQCIGSTTAAEYRKYVEKDGALKRRFQNVQVEEPGKDDTLKIIETISPKYEEYHKVKYSGEVLKCCVEWSSRYITDRYFPDKAIDCLDRAGATAGLRQKYDTSELDEIKSKIKELTDKKIAAVNSQDFEKAAQIRDEQKALEKELDKKVQSFKKSRDSKRNWIEVTIDDIAGEVSRISKVPIDKIRSTDRSKIKDMKSILSRQVIGQNEAVDKILISLQRNIMGFRDESKPIASFLLCGETGTGKSLISKIVAREFFGSDNSLVRIDCGELSDGKASVSKLTGATPGYVGYEDEPILEQIKRKPFSVLLVDEVDKAVPEAFNIFMNILDEGYCILGNGEKVDFRNTIIIFTGNIGTREIQANGTGLGFNTAKTKEELHKVEEDIVKKSIGKFFRPEFLNRLTGTVVFNSLTKDDLKSIFVLEFAKVKSRIGKSGYQIKVSNSLRDKVIEECDTKFGARDLNRSITKYIENELCSALIDASDEDLENLKSVQLDWVDKKVITTFVKKSEKAKKERVNIEMITPAEEIEQE